MAKKTQTTVPEKTKNPNRPLETYQPPRARFPFAKEARLFNVPSPDDLEYHPRLARLMRSLNRKLGRKGRRLQAWARKEFKDKTIELILRRTPRNQFRLVLASHPDKKHADEQ